MKLALALGALVAVPVLALAQVPGLPTPDDLGAFLQVFVSASVNVKVALALIALVWAVRKFVVQNVKFFQTDEGGVILLSFTSFVTMLAASFYGLQGEITMAWLGQVSFKAFATAAIAGGTWNLIQAYVRVLAPKVIQGKIAKVPGIGIIVQKLAEYALKMVKSKLEKVAADPIKPVVPAPVVEKVEA